MLYLTADIVGAESGGGLVTKNESLALQSLGPCEVWDGHRLGNPPSYFSAEDSAEPWKYDNWFSYNYSTLLGNQTPRLAHFYAGTWTKTVAALQANGCRVSFTAAAHDIAVSRREHEALGLPYDYPHLTQPDLLQRYLGGYLAADVLIVPSQHSKRVMEGLGRTGRIEVIPHGVHLPKCQECGGRGTLATGPNDITDWDQCPVCKGAKVQPIAPLPERFTVGYLGSFGPDKGVRYLLEAWKRLAYTDATLVLAGRDSTSPWVKHLVQTFGGGNIRLVGWVDRVSDFYNGISLYVQPSASEGFGCEVLEAMAHGRPVLCSTGAGAADVVYPYDRFTVGYVEALAELIDNYRQQSRDDLTYTGEDNRNRATRYAWDKIRNRYCDVWRSLL